MDKLLSRLRVDYKNISFKKGDQFSWSPATNTVTYPAKSSSNAAWSLLHELGHAVLGHQDYKSDLELVSLESKAWEAAKKIGLKYDVVIDEDHIQDCMDTYRDWLHMRSACPTCGTRSLQQDSRTYRCYNCNQTWTVTTSRFCRPYRRKSDQNKTSPSEHVITFS